MTEEKKGEGKIKSSGLRGLGTAISRKELPGFLNRSSQENKGPRGGKGGGGGGEGEEALGVAGKGLVKGGQTDRPMNWI